MANNLSEDICCPECGKPLKMGEGHSCQDSEEDEFIRMRTLERSDCPHKTREHVEAMRKSGIDQYEKGDIINEDN